jgi:D-alanyl-D-alanine dipeptidase
MLKILNLDRCSFTARLVGIALLIVFGASNDATLADATLPDGLVYLREIDPTIIQEIRYATRDNFTGDIVPGYSAGECILTRATADALAKVQAKVRAQSFNLKVYDCYRPVRAAQHFMRWIAANGDGGSKTFYPEVARRRLSIEGYIAKSSSHSRGIAVDATLVPLTADVSRTFDPTKSYGPCNGPRDLREPDSSVDMGTGFDCFDKKSFSDSPALSMAQRDARRHLVAAMSAHGFQNYRREWWHFTFDNARSQPAFDFVIEAPWK